ncbi:major facilitator superfamily domain-containing protein [Radiomyces spectabilis]|uniref:major facilitator superfamily domain-containing protein n=1 Tax=Radiomyces spectabilis TaxID=64574 RepID=UPI00221E7D9F|nr:major facilitator superfamily domain-containing protein [Radiomyces spectabilis]KAI8365251.1 major facilitator superfamily domain-containing protein [Radiomyces spectabilis]
MNHSNYSDYKDATALNDLPVDHDALSTPPSGDHVALSTPPSAEAELPPRKFLWLIPLAPHVHPIKLLAFIISTFAGLALIVYLSMSQTYVLTTILAISANTGDITGSLALYGEIVSVIAVVLWGVVSDRVQKRTIITFSLMLMGIVNIAYPHVKDVYPDMLMLKLIFSAGTAGMTAMMAAMMMEVVHGSGGYVAALIGASCGLGAVFAALFLGRTHVLLAHKLGYANDGIILSFSTVGACTIFVAFLLWFFMPGRPPASYYTNGVPPRRENFFKRLYIGFKAAKEPRIALGFVTSFFARADEIIITNFITLWINQYYIDQGTCQVGRPCYQAMGTSSTLTGISQAVALVSTPFFGAASEHFPREFAVVAAGIIGACGCIPFAFSIDPTSNACMAFVVLLAIGQFGMITSGMALINGPYVAPEHRGSVAGAYSFCGAIGIIIISKIGGVLFDKWMKGAPFLLLGIGHCIVTVLCIIEYAARLFKERRQRRALQQL